MHRRQFSTVLFASFAATSLARAASAPDFSSQLTQIERASGGRLGVAVLDTGSGRRAGHREDERFPMCSTFKLLACAHVLARVDRGEERLDRRVVFGAQALVVNSPVTRQHAGGEGMTMAQLCEAAITQSDNTAGNLLLASFGGPKAFTAYARSLGDTLTRLDRTETALNEALPGDPRDTTTPHAMLGNLHKLLLGPALSPASRAQLLRWLEANKTGDERIRARLPADWKVGDKTGAGERGSTNDIGILQPPRRAPILVTIYLTQTSAPAAARNAALASVGAAVAAWA